MTNDVPSQGSFTAWLSISKPRTLRTPRAYVVRNYLADALDARPRTFMRIQRRRQRTWKSVHRLVTADHHLVLDAFPRSGSSFAHVAFKRANPASAGKIGTHIHRSAHVIEGARLGIPTLVLLRAPESAVTSLMALGVQNGELPMLSPADAQLCIAETLRRYIRFHTRISHLETIVLATFEEVVSDFGDIIDRVNTRCGTTFARFDHNDDTVAEIFDSTRHHLSPNADRDAVKSAVRKSDHSPKLVKLRLSAEDAYLNLKKRAVHTASHT